RMQAALVRKMTPNRAAAVTTTVVTLMIVIPAAFLITTLARQAPQAIERMSDSSQHPSPQMQRIWNAVTTHSPVPLPKDPTEFTKTAMQRALAFVAPRAGAWMTDSLAVLGNLVAMLFAFFFMVRDGDALRQRLRDRMPFPEDQSERLLDDVRELVRASFGASLIVAAAQGLIGGLAFGLLHVGAPVFWGVVMAFVSLLPVGASIVWLPASIGLLLSGETTRGILLLLVG